MAAATQIEFVLPLRVANGERGSDFVRARSGLIASINRFCDRDFVKRLSVIVPADDVSMVQQLVAECDIPVNVMGENEILPVERIGDIPRRGWFLQQFIKLAYAKICTTDFYVTLDADVFLIKPLNKSVFRDGLAPAKYEPTGKHLGWWEMSARALELQSSAIDFDEERAFGVTPAFLSAAIVREVINRLDKLAEGKLENDWITYLCNRTDSQNRCWTEYSLYWTVLINQNDPKKLYYDHDLYLFSYYPWRAWTTISDSQMRYPQLFCVIQSSEVNDEVYAEFVKKFLTVVS